MHATAPAEEAYQQYHGRILALARSVTRDDALAEDATQDVFVRLWLDPDRYDANRGSLSSFLLVQARGRAVDLVRSDRARRAREVRADNSRSVWSRDHDDYATVERRETLQRAMDLLPAAERQAIWFAYFGGLTYREVAARLDLPEGTVKSRISAGLRRLRASLGDVNSVTS